MSRRLRENARRFAEKNLAMQDYLKGYDALIAKLVGS
jgi:hypothetical protein